jgi:hypothetical protein
MSIAPFSKFDRQALPARSAVLATRRAAYQPPGAAGGAA